MLIDSGVVTSSLSVSGSYNQTGNAVITGSLTVTGGITGSITSASYAFNADLLDDLDSTAFLYTSSFNAFSSSYSGRISNSEVTASALTAASSSLSIRVSNTEATSSVLTSASGSFSTRVTNTEATASSLTTASGSFSTRVTGLETASGSFSTRTTNLETTSSNLVNASGSFSTRVTNTEATASSLVTASGSFSTRVTNTEATASNLVPRVVNLEATASNLTTASGSFSTRVTGLESASGSFSTRMTNEEATGSRLNTASASFALVSSSYSPMSGSTSTRLTGLESASGSFSTRVTNTEATASNLVPRVVLLETTASNFVLTSGSVSSRVTNLEVTASSLTTRTTNLENASGSFSTRVTSAESSITSLTNASGSFSTRVTNEEATGSRLVTASGSFSTRVTTNETNISSLQTASGSASTRLTNLESASGSFSTRVTTLESASGSTSTRLTSLETASGSFSNRVTNTEATASNLVPRVTLLETTASNFVLTSGSVSSRVTNLEVTASSLTSITNNLTAASGSFSTRTTNLESTASVLTNASASFVNMSSSLSIRVTNAEASVTSLNAKTGSYATTGSNTFTGTQTVQGTIIAQTLNVQQVTSSIVYSSGSNTFGKLPGTDVQSMTGSLRVSGSGEHYIVGGSVGIGATSPLRKLHVAGGTFAVNGSTSEYYGVNISGGEGANPNILIGDWHNASANLTWDSTNRFLRIDSQYSTDGAPIVFSGNDAGIEYMRLTSVGNVGINTTSPNYKFHVVGTDAALDTDSSMRFYINRAGTNVGSIIFTTGGPGTAKGWAEIGQTDGNGDLYFKANPQSGSFTTRMIIQGSSGNVGIGSISPAYKLDVAGDINLTGNLYFNSTTLQAARKYVSVFNLSNAGYTVIGTVTGANYASGVRISLQGTADSTVINTVADILVNHSTDILITSQAGIYTNVTLRVKSDNNEVFSIEATTDSTFTCGTNVEIFPLGSETVSFGGSAQTGASLTHLCSPGIKISATGGNDGNFAVNGLGYFGGSLGIGTTNPATELHVVGNGGWAELRLAGSTAGSGGAVEFYSGSVQLGDVYMGSSKDLTFRVNGANTAMYISSSGNVGIGTTSPLAKLHVAGELRNSFGSGVGGINYLNIIDGVSNGFRTTITTGNAITYTFHNGANSGVFNILESGNVGIGSTSPKAKLDINEVFGVGSKSFTCTSSYTTGLTINLNAHTGVYVKVTLHGDLGGYSAIGYVGEYFIQNGAGSYSEPGIIIREVNNTSNGGSIFSAQIVDPAGNGTRNFELQFKHDVSGTSVGTTLIYQIQGTYNSIS